MTTTTNHIERLIEAFVNNPSHNTATALVRYAENHDHCHDEIDEAEEWLNDHA